MKNVNVVALEGRVARDLSANDYTAWDSGLSRLRFSIAVNRASKKGGEWKDEASFFDVEAWGRLADALKDRLCKGAQVLLSGGLKQERWQSRDGQSCSRVVVVADVATVFQSPQAGQADAAFKGGAAKRGGGQEEFIDDEIVPF